jgi:hypothetical protein
MLRVVGPTLRSGTAPVKNGSVPVTWKPTEDIDENVRQWMKAKGWEVRRPPEYDADGEVYAWRHDLQVGSSHTLRMEKASICRRSDSDQAAQGSVSGIPHGPRSVSTLHQITAQVRH